MNWLLGRKWNNFEISIIFERTVYMASRKMHLQNKSAIRVHTFTGHHPSEGRVGKGKGEGRMGLFRRQRREGRLVKKFSAEKNNKGRYWFWNFEKKTLEKAFSSFQSRSFSCENWLFRRYVRKKFHAAHVCWKEFASNSNKVVQTFILI